jgi:hypothetical protein
LTGLIIGLVLAYGLTFVPSPRVPEAGLARDRNQDLLGLLAWVVDASLPAGLPSIGSDTPPFTVEYIPRSASVMSLSPLASTVGSQQLYSPDWSSPYNVSRSAERSVNPVVLAGNGGVVHVVWEENERIFHSVREGDTWGSPRRLATGFQPSAALTADGTVHLVYSNEFWGQFNVFYVRWDQGTWTLPRMVSKTTGTSAYPVIAIDGSGVVHAAWADTTPGFSIIYHGWLEETWLNEPLHNARGTIPQLVYDHVHSFLRLVYQAIPISSGNRDVFHVEGGRYQWSLPENISRLADRESLSFSAAIDGEGLTHVLWQEQEGAGSYIKYSRGTRGNWSEAERISSEGVNAREPKVLVTHDTQISAVWREDNTIRYRRRVGATGNWHGTISLLDNMNGLSNVDLTSAPDGELHLVWGGWSSTSDRDVYHSRRNPLLGPKVFLPGIVIN